MPEIGLIRGLIRLAALARQSLRTAPLGPKSMRNKTAEPSTATIRAVTIGTSPSERLLTEATIIEKTLY
jgi:hypothetical protein